MVFCFAFLRSYVFISNQNVKAKSNRNRNCISFIPLGIPRVEHWIISFMLHISVINSPTNWYLYQWVSWNISEVINENSTSVFNYLDDFRPHKSKQSFQFWLFFEWFLQEIPTIDHANRSNLFNFDPFLNGFCRKSYYATQIEATFSVSTLFWMVFVGILPDHANGSNLFNFESLSFFLNYWLIFYKK